MKIEVWRTRRSDLWALVILVQGWKKENMEIWDTKFRRNETEKLNYVTKSIEIKKVKNNIYSSHLADRNMHKCRTIWRTKSGSGSSHGRSL